MKSMRKSLTKLATIAVATTTAFAFVVGSGHASPIEIDKTIPAYQKTSNIAGNLNSVGSDTLNNLMTYWAESFGKQYPNVRIQIEGKGSSTAPPALINGVAQLGPMSRKMKSKEIDEFEKKYGFKPTTIGVALDSLAVFVNKDNPIQSLSLEQVDGIFSKTRKSGHAEIITWGEIIPDSPLAAHPISLYGRNSASGTYGYFKEHALFKGDYKDTVKEQPGSASVVMGITEDTTAIGYSGIGYKTSGVKALPLSTKDGEAVFEPTYENVLSGKYPLSRLLYISMAKAPNQPLDPLVKEFVKFVLSKEGQEIVVKDGYLPLPKSEIDRQLQILE